MGLKIYLDGNIVGNWKAQDGGDMTEDEAAQIATIESEIFGAYVDDLFDRGDGDFLAVLVRNEG